MGGGWISHILETRPRGEIGGEMGGGDLRYIRDRGRGEGWGGVGWGDLR